MDKNETALFRPLAGTLPAHEIWAMPRPKDSVPVDGPRVRRRRESLDLACDQLGVSAKTVDRMERGQAVSRASVNMVARHLGVTPESIIVSHAAIPLDTPDAGIEVLFGRDDDLLQVQQLLHSGSRIVAVRGTPGLGKTSLVVEYLHRHIAEYRQAWWCNAEDPEKLARSLMKFGVELGVVEDDDSDHDGEAAKTVIAYLERESIKTLLVYDNAETVRSLGKLLPRRGSDVLITSRFPKPEGVASISLAVLDRNASIDLIVSLAGRNDRDGAGILAEVFDGLPLALDQAAAFCGETGMPFWEYADRAQALINDLPAGRPYHDKGIYATVEIALNYIANHPKHPCPSVRRLMYVVGFCAPDLIPLEILDSPFIGDNIMCATARLRLYEVSLLRHDLFPDDSTGFRVHRAVRMVARDIAEKTGQAHIGARAVDRAIRTVFSKQPSREDPAWITYGKLLPHVNQWRMDFSTFFPGLDHSAPLRNIANYYFLDGRLDDAIDYLSLSSGLLAFASFATGQSGDLLSAIDHLHSLAGVLEVGGKHESLIVISKMGLRLTESLFGSNHRYSVLFNIKLGQGLTSMGDYDGGLLILAKQSKFVKI